MDEIVIELNTVQSTIIVVEKNCCCICLEDIDIGEIVTMKCCLNDLHKKCLFDILMYTQNLIFNCPLCRTQLNFKSDNILTLNEILNIYTLYKDTFVYVDHPIRLQYIIDDYIINTTNNIINTNSEKYTCIKRIFAILIVLCIMYILLSSLK